MFLEMLAVVHEQDSVARRYPEYREEPDEGSQRDDATGKIVRQHATDESHRQGQEDQQRQSPAAEGHLQQQKDH